MRISSKREYLWSDRQQRYLLIRDLSEKWTGPVALAKGASAAMTDQANAQAAFTTQLTQDYATQFANQNSILQTLQKSLNPIIAGGPNQMGYSTAQLNALNSTALQSTGQQAANAARASNENMAAAGGGNSYLPSGVQAQQKAQIASQFGNQASSELLGIQNAGYQQGYQQYESAVGQLGGVAGLYSPTSYAGAANTAGANAFNAANQVAQMNNAASPWNMVGGLLGGAIGTGLDMFTGGLGGAIGTGLGGLGGGSNPLEGGITNEGYGSNGALTLGGVGQNS